MKIGIIKSLRDCTPWINGWWDKLPLAPEDVALCEDLRVSSNFEPNSHRGHRVSPCGADPRSTVREQAWSNGTSRNASRGTAALDE